MTERLQPDLPSIARLLAAARAVLDAEELPGPDGTIDDLVSALAALRRAVEAFDNVE